MEIQLHIPGSWKVKIKQDTINNTDIFDDKNPEFVKDLNYSRNLNNSLYKNDRYISFINTVLRTIKNTIL